MSQCVFSKVYRFGEVVNAHVKSINNFQEWSVEFISWPLYPFKLKKISVYLTFDHFSDVRCFLESLGFYLRHSVDLDLYDPF